MSNHNIYIKMHTNTYVHTYHIHINDYTRTSLSGASLKPHSGSRPKKTERQAPWPLALRRTSWKLRLDEGLGAMGWFFRENMDVFCVFLCFLCFSMVLVFFSVVFLWFSYAFLRFFSNVFCFLCFSHQKTMRNTRVFPVKTCGFQINISTFHRTDLLRVRSEVPFF